MTTSLEWHLVLLLPPEEDLRAVLERAWLPYLNTHDVQVDRIVVQETFASMADRVARALGVEPAVLAELRAPEEKPDLPEPVRRALRLEYLSQWGRLLSQWVQEGGRGVAVMAEGPVLQGLFHLCFGLPLTEDHVLALRPGALVHLFFQREHDRWVLAALWG